MPFANNNDDTNHMFLEYSHWCIVVMNSNNDDGGDDDDDEHVDLSDDCGHNIIVGFYVLFNFQSFIIPADHAMLLFDTYVL